MKNVLTHSSKAAKFCFDKEVDLMKFETCIDLNYPVFSLVKRLIEDSKAGNYGGMALDAA